MCNVEIAEVYVVENAPYCKLNYNMARFLFYLLSFLYYLRGYFYCFLSSHTHGSLFFIAFLLGCGYFLFSTLPYPWQSIFLLIGGYFSWLLLSIPMAVYFL